MARNRSVLNVIRTIADDHAPKPFQVDGFSFEMDDEPREILEPLKGMPKVKGFLYVDDDSQAYGDAPESLSEQETA